SGVRFRALGGHALLRSGAGDVRRGRAGRLPGGAGYGRGVERAVRAASGARPRAGSGVRFRALGGHALLRPGAGDVRHGRAGRLPGGAGYGRGVGGAVPAPCGGHGLLPSGAQGVAEGVVAVRVGGGGCGAGQLEVAVGIGHGRRRPAVRRPRCVGRVLRTGAGLPRSLRGRAAPVMVPVGLARTGRTGRLRRCDVVGRLRPLPRWARLPLVHALPAAGRRSSTPMAPWPRRPRSTVRHPAAWAWARPPDSIRSAPARAPDGPGISAPCRRRTPAAEPTWGRVRGPLRAGWAGGCRRGWPIRRRPAGAGSAGGSGGGPRPRPPSSARAGAGAGPRRRWDSGAVAAPVPWVRAGVTLLPLPEPRTSASGTMLDVTQPRATAARDTAPAATNANRSPREAGRSVSWRLTSWMRKP